jgi:hypothetical protein
MFYRIFILLSLVFVFALVALSTTRGTESNDEVRPSVSLRQEVPDDEYIPVSPESRRTSPAYSYSSSEIFTTQVNVDSLGMNIIGDAANEPSIAVDPNDPGRVAIGWRQFDTISSNFRQAGWGYTADAGSTWTFPGVIEPGFFRSDPVLAFDTDGNFYYNSLAVDGGDFWCDVFKSTDGGATWDLGTFAEGGDKQWMAIDRSGGIGNGNHYAYWTYAYSICEPDFFTRSPDGGISYEECDTIPGLPYWGTLDVGPDGELYVGAAGGYDYVFVVAKSTNAQDSSQAVSWDFVSDVDLDGYVSSGEGPNPGGLLGQAWIATDHSTGPTRGNVYLLCSVDRFTGTDPLDVMFARSTDGGETWSSPVRVNDDPDTTAYQWFGTMSVAPNGRIDVIWLDTRDDPVGYDSALYYSYSTDAGVTWSVNERLSDTFDPHLGWPQQNKMGDYFHMVSDDTGAHLAWAGTFNGEQDVYYSHIVSGQVGIGDQDREPTIPRNFLLSQNYPNPFNPSTTISFEIPSGVMTNTPGVSVTKQRVNLTVYDIRGRRVRRLVDSDLEPGSHSIHWDGKNDGGQPVASGLYLYTLKTGGKVFTKKMTMLK